MLIRICTSTLINYGLIGRFAVISTGLIRSGLILAVLVQPTSFSVTPGKVRALQTGPVGDGVGLVSVKGTSVEALLDHQSFETVQKDQTSGSAGERWTSEHTTTNYRGGAGFKLSPKMQFLTSVSVNTVDYDVKTASGTRQVDDFVVSEFRAGPILDENGLIIAGQVGVTQKSSFSAKAISAGTAHELEVASAFFPFAEGAVGFRLSQTSILAGFRTYNGKKVDASLDTSFGSEKIEFVQDTPGEIRFDLKHRLISELTAGVSFTYFVMKNTNRKFSADSPLRELFPEQDDYMRLALGGMYYANQSTAFFGGFLRQDPSFQGNRNVSPFRSNLGHTRFDIGMHYRPKFSEFYFNIGHILPEATNATRTEKDADLVVTDRLVKIEQSGWAFSLGSVFQL